MAAVADELSQQQRWLAHYQVAEKRHARRVRVQGILYRLELARRALMRFLRRLALTSLRLARSVVSFVSRTAIALFVTLSRAVTACITWIRPRAYALALLLRRWLAAFWAWTVATLRTLARALLKATSISWAWLVVQSRALAVTLARWASAAWAWTSVHAVMLARASFKGASTGFAWLAATSLALAIALWHGLVRILRRTRALARILARNALTGIRIASSWTAATSRTLAVTLRQWSSRSLEMDSRRGADHHARIAQGNAAGIVMDRSQLAHGRGRIAAQCFRRRRLVGSECQSSEPRLSRCSLGELFLGRSQHQQHLAWLPACRAAAVETNHRAVVVRRCTALVCVEQKRVHLPMIRAN